MPEGETIPHTWENIIADLESDLELLKTGNAPPRPASTPWTAPTSAGPLPEEYANYVRGLIEKQREAIVELEAARKSTAERLAAVRSAETRVEQSVYLDVEG